MLPSSRSIRSRIGVELDRRDVRNDGSNGKIPVMARGTQIFPSSFPSITTVLAGVHLRNENNAHSTISLFPSYAKLSLFQTTDEASLTPSKATCSAVTDSTSNLEIPFNKTLPAAKTPKRSILLREASYAASSGKDMIRFNSNIKIPTEPRRIDVRSDVKLISNESIADRFEGPLLLLLLLLKETFALFVERNDDLFESTSLLLPLFFKPSRCLRWCTNETLVF
mmetsp:Transcript_4050/g.6761  ORF Transcript_4050/g.6761 Transcript_4050/m.6761 type:complete len:224 (+) Transcript_4050:293-964(+)